MKSMKNTSASGAIELIRYADSHIQLATAYDRRIAFIGIDNSVEVMIRTFLSLPSSKSGIRILRKDIEAAENSLLDLVALLWQRTVNLLTGIEEGDIEHYHRLRNGLYRNGIGLSVDQQHLFAYRQIAVLLLKNLFEVEMEEPRAGLTLERLVVLWYHIQEALKWQLKNAGIDPMRSYLSQAGTFAGVLRADDISHLTQLRVIRNAQVQSSRFYSDEVEMAIHLAEALLSRLKQNQS